MHIEKYLFLCDFFLFFIPKRLRFEFDFSEDEVSPTETDTEMSDYKSSQSQESSADSVDRMKPFLLQMKNMRL